MCRSMRNLTRNVTGKQLEQADIDELTAELDEAITAKNEAAFDLFHSLFLGDIKEELTEAQQIERLEEHKSIRHMCNIFFK